jgi:hypothetical protein
MGLERSLDGMTGYKPQASLPPTELRCYFAGQEKLGTSSNLV